MEAGPSTRCIRALRPDCLRVQRGEAQAKLAIADRDSPAVHLYDARSGSNEAVGSAAVHRAPVLAMRYNEPHDTVISTDDKGAPQATRSGFRAQAHDGYAISVALPSEAPRGTKAEIVACGWLWLRCPS